MCSVGFEVLGVCLCELGYWLGGFVFMFGLIVGVWVCVLL